MSAEAERRHQLIRIETMLRDGRTEHEINAALRGDPVHDQQSNATAFLRWVGAKLGT